MHPILVTIGPLRIYTYGTLVALGVLVAWFVLKYRAERYGISRSQLVDLLVFLFLSGILGARLFFVLQHWEHYNAAIWKVFMINEGGLVWYGGFFFAAVTGILFARRSHLPVFRTADFLAPAIPLGHAIGRIGCYLNGCCYGFAGHPVQLYEAAGLLVLGIWLARVSVARYTPGSLFLFYVLGYSILRFILEFWRGDQIRIYNLTTPQWTSLVLFAGSLILFKSLNRKS